MAEDYGEEDYEAMLAPFRDAFEAMGSQPVDRWALKEIFEALGNVTSDEEFEQQFQDIDTDQDGFITFEDFKRMVMGQTDQPTDVDFYYVNENTLTADALSLLNELFETYKKQDPRAGLIMDLKIVKAQLQRQKQAGEPMRVPPEVFDSFFGAFMTNKTVISQQEFSDLIAKNEDSLLEIGTNVDKPRPMKLGQQAPETEREAEQDRPVIKKQSSLGGTEYANKLRNESMRLQREEQTSLFAYTINELSQHTETPEVQLNDVLQILVESSGYEDFKANDWQAFFRAFTKKFDHLKERIRDLEQAESTFKGQYEQVEADKEATYSELQQLREEIKIAFEQNDQLTTANNELASYLTIFREVQASEARLRDYLSSEQNKNAEMRAQLQIALQNERELSDGIQDYEETINELRLELQSARQIILQEGKEKELRDKKEMMRQSIMAERASTVQTNTVVQTKVEVQYVQQSVPETKEEQELHEVSADNEAKYMRQLQEAAKSTKLSDSERKGMLMIAQQFERYKKAFEASKSQNESIQEEKAKLEKQISKVSEQADERKRQNNKDKKEIEKLKTKTDILTREKEELSEKVTTLNKEIGRINQNAIKRQEAPKAVSPKGLVKDLSGVAPREGVSRSTDVLGMKLKKFGAKAEVSPKAETKEMTIEDELQMENLGDENMNFDIERVASDSFNLPGGGDFVSNTIMDIRRSMADSSFVIPLPSQRVELGPSADTFTLDERMSQWGAQPTINVLSMSGKDKPKPQTMNNLLNAKRQKHSSFGKGNFRPTMLNNVAEEDEDEQRRSTIQNAAEFSAPNDDPFENFSTHEVEEDQKADDKRDNSEVGDLDDELKEAGNDDVKRLDVLLKHLTSKSITKEQFISKLKPAVEIEHETVSENDVIAVPTEDDFVGEVQFAEPAIPSSAGLLKAAKNSVLSSQSADSDRAIRVHKQTSTISTQTESEEEVVRVKESLVQYCKEMQSVLTDSKTKSKLTAEEHREVEASHKMGIEFLNQVSLATTSGDFKTMQATLQKKFDPIVTRIKLDEKLQLDAYCKQIGETLSDAKLAARLPADDKRKIQQLHSEGVAFVQNESSDRTPEEYSKKLETIKSVYQPIMWRLLDIDRRKLERFPDQMTEALKDSKLSLSQEEKKTIESAHKEAMRFIEESGISATIQDISKKQTEIETKVNPIINKGKQQDMAPEDREDGQTVVGKPDSKIGLDRKSEGQEQRFSQGLSFGRKVAAPTFGKNTGKDDFFDKNRHTLQDEENSSDSDDGGKFFMPNLQGRKSKQVKSESRADALRAQSNDMELEFENRDTNLQPAIIEDDEEDEEESKDTVSDLKVKFKLSDSHISDNMFDQLIEKNDGPQNKQQVQDKIRMSVKDQFQVEQRVSKVQALLSRNSHVNRMSTRTSVINATSNKKDFDYLFLTKSTNEKMYEPVRKILALHGETGSPAVFSEHIQSFDPSLKVTEYIVLVTTRSLYLLDRKGQKVGRYELSVLKQIIMIKTNPCIFALSFGGHNNPLLLQSFRRSELIMFLLTHTKNNSTKVSVARSKGIRIFLHDKNKQMTNKVITFEKVAIKENNATSKQLMNQIEKNVQLNNFANAINSGYLKMATKAFLGTKWEERFVVLTNVGLLYFTDPHQPPLDLFPVLDCEIVKVPANEVKGDENTFKLVYLTKHVTFQCASRAEYENWTKQIKRLQQVTVEVRDRLKQEEVRRMTMLMGQGM